MGEFKIKRSRLMRFRLKAAWFRWLQASYGPGANVRPFIVTGPPRSGTSLLTALLTRKPNVLVANEPVIVSDLFLAHGAPARLLRGYTYATARRAYKDGTLKTKVDPTSKDRPTTDTWNVGATREFVSVKIREDQNLCVGVKHPIPFMEYLHELVTGWPELKVIVSVREPGPTIRSWRETGFGWQPQIEDKSEGLWRRMYNNLPQDVEPLERRAHLWNLLVERGSQFAAEYPKQVMVTRYEDLVQKPAETMQQMFSHIGATDPGEKIDVSDVKYQERPSYKGFTEDEATMIQRVCGKVDEQTVSTG